jgi:hypothetical protein
MNPHSGHAVFACLDHAGPAIVVLVLAGQLLRPAVVTPTFTVQGNGPVAELAAVFGDSVARSAEIERILTTVTFPPSADAAHSLAEALAACGMSALSEPRRLQLAGHIYATTTGGDLPRDRLALMLRQIQQAAIDARCSPVVVTAIVESVGRAARSDPKPRRDWW